MKNLNKIISVLSLAASDTRDDTIKSIIKSTLFESTSPISTEVIKQYIDVLFDLEIYESELKENLTNLENSGEILANKGYYRIADAEREKLKVLDFKVKTEEMKRYDNFCKFIAESLKINVEKEGLVLLWDSYKEYLYNSFFTYGIKAIEYLNPTFKENKEQHLSNTDHANDIIAKFSTATLKGVFKKVIEKFLDSANTEDIEFINELGQKTLAFTSLGISKEDADDNFQKELIDWTLYLDTNFLFSILDLHINNENDASKELLSLVLMNKNLIKIKFRYTESTLKELKHKKGDFENLDNTLTNSGIRALLQSDEVDEFSKKFYNSLLNNKDETIHPIQIIDLADVTLPSKGIEISKNKARIDTLGESYLNIKVADYQKFIGDQNSYRETYSQEHNVKLKTHSRSDSQCFHDITLRELILSLRKSTTDQIKTFNQVKYFGVTLDELLIKYDNHELNREATKQYPTFFRPSFLLNQLVKILPVKTDNYKKAFIKAVSAKGFHKGSNKSNDILRIVSYLKNQGIDNEDIILNLISEKLFIDNYHKQSVLDGFDEKDFFEAEVNKLYEKKNKEAEEAQRKARELEQQHTANEEEKAKLKSSFDGIEKEKNLYHEGLLKLRKKVTILEKKISKPIEQPEINFEASGKDKRIKDLESELETTKKDAIKRENEDRKQKRDLYYAKKIRKWRRNSIIEVVVCVLIFIGSIVYLLYWNGWSMIIDEAKTRQLSNNIIIGSLVWIISAVLNIFVIRGLFEKYRNHSNITNYKNSLPLPNDLKDI